jgi:hypothetical protein
MSELRSTEQRKADVLAVLGQNGDAWLATADQSGRPHLIAVSTWWDGSLMVITTTDGSRTARNLDEIRLGRLGIGSTNDAIMVDLEVLDSVPVADAAADLVAGFSAAAGLNHSEEGPKRRFFRLRPSSKQPYRGYGELESRDVLRDGTWLA